MRFPLSLVFLALVFGEIAGFILVGQAIGVLPTLALVLLGMVGGLALLRVQGLSTLNRVRTEAAAGRVPARPLAEGAVRAVAALLIVVPGFITDVIGLLLLVPVVRTALLAALRSRLLVKSAGAGGTQAQGAIVDLGESDYDARPRAGSPWRLRSGPMG